MTKEEFVDAESGPRMAKETIALKMLRKRKFVDVLIQDLGLNLGSTSRSALVVVDYLCI